MGWDQHYVVGFFVLSPPTPLGGPLTPQKSNQFLRFLNIFKLRWNVELLTTNPKVHNSLLSYLNPTGPEASLNRVSPNYPRQNSLTFPGFPDNFILISSCFRRHKNS